jgi:hypothetical protein
VQALAVDEHLAKMHAEVRLALYLDVAKEVLVDRIAGRWLCPSCQATYPSHSGTAPHEGKCQACMDDLYQRPDDHPEVVQKRIEVYLQETMPVIDHYAASNLVVRLDGNRSIEQVRATLCASLGGVVRGHRRSHWHLYISDALHADRDGTKWHGRTLCRRYVDSTHSTVRGTEDDFHIHPCRHCFIEIRPRQRPILELPTQPLQMERQDVLERPEQSQRM